MNRRTLRFRRRGQSGFSLIEAIVGTVIVALLMTGLGAGLGVLNSSSSEANLSSRLDSMTSAAGQVLKTLPYEECADEATYENAFGVRESGRPAEEQILKASSSLTPTLTVDTVNGGSGCDSEDAGYQRVSYTVAFTDSGGGIESFREAEVVKFDPSRALTVPYAEIDAPPQLETASGSAFATYSFTALGSSSEVGIADFRWHCGNENTPGAAELPIDFGPPEDPGLVLTADDSDVRCRFPASTTGTQTYEVRLEVTDTRGQTATDTIPVVVATQDVALPLPTAAASITSGNGGVFPVTTQFSSAGSGVPGGTLTYRWTFGDLSRGAANTSNQPNPSFTYDRPDTYTAQLTVTDQYGQTDQRSVNVVVTSNPGVFLPPTAVISVTDQLRYAPTIVDFDGQPSAAASANPIQSYFWNFGDGVTSTEPAPRHPFTTSGTHTVELTVTDTFNNSHTTSETVTMAEFKGPASFRVTGKRTWLPLIVSGRTSFAWTNPEKAPGETYAYQFKIDYSTFILGISCPFGNLSDLTPPPTWDVVGERSDWTWNGDFCAGSAYKGQMRIKRTGANVPTGSAWSTWTPEREWPM